AGILIIWDRMFGTFQVEEETPRYGLKRNFNSQNPFHVWFSELPGLWRDLKASRSLREIWMRLFAHPGWDPTQR
ncbi:MAG: sterol desaturase family protein, partial [Pseudomonadota bacterium]